MCEKFKLICLCIILSLSYGCASAKQYVPLPDQSLTVEDPNKGRIYVIRPASIGGAIKMKVRDGEEKIGNTGPKSFLCWEREPGQTTLYSKSENTSKLPLEVEKGEVYYVLQKVKMGVIIARNSIELIDEERGKKYLEKCKPAKFEAAP